MTATTPADPFAEVSEDEFAEPVTEFLGLEDLDGRLVIVFPKATKEGTSKTNGDKYDIVVSDVVIVDGPTTDKVPSLPHIVKDMYLSSTGVVARIRSYLGQDKPVLGRIDSMPSKYNKKVMAYSIATPTDEDKAAARPALQEYRKQQFA